MKQRALWSRREFVQGMSLAAVGSRLPRPTGASPLKPRFAYVGSGDSTQGIAVFAIQGDRWTPVQTISSEHPTALALHPRRHLLYAANEIDSYQGLPSGTVEAYAIDPASGRLTLLNRQPLSLSGTMPRHLAVSPDGSNVVVAVHGGGAYNVLPLGADGSVQRVSGIVKEVGSGPNEDHQEAAHPQMVLFDTTGRHLLGTDLGSDRLNVFTLSGNKLAINHRSATQPGSGPRHMALHPAGHLLYVANHLEATVSCYGYDAASGRLLNRLQHGTLDDGAGALMIHPSGRFLYTAGKSDGIAAWRIDSTTGALTAAQLWSEGAASPHAMAMMHDGTGLLVLSRAGDSVVHLHVDPASGQLSDPLQVAKVSSPMSLALKYV